MVKRKNKQKQQIGWAPPFFSGIVLGAILVSCVYYFGISNFDPDNEFLKTFPDIERTFPNITFEFPERLQETDPERVGAKLEPDEPNVEIKASSDPVVEAIPVMQEQDADESPEEIELPKESEETVTGYVLQAGAFTEEKHADSFRASLLIEGYNAFTKQTSDANSDVQFRVIVGPYDTVEASQEDSKRLKERNISTFVVPMREGSL